MTKLIDPAREGIRRFVRIIARSLNSATHGRVSPNSITIVGLLAHVPIAFLIATGNHNILAAVLLVVFGLFDTLDGQVAQLQNKTSPRGMLLDSATDRIKEVLLYMGIVYAFAVHGESAFLIAVTVAALGSSMLTSYLNAMGDAIMSKHKTSQHAANKTFRGGVLPFEIRMTVLMLGLLTGQLPVAVSAIVLLAGYTALQRLVRITKVL